MKRGKGGGEQKLIKEGRHLNQAPLPSWCSRCSLFFFSLFFDANDHPSAKSFSVSLTDPFEQKQTKKEREQQQGHTLDVSKHRPFCPCAQATCCWRSKISFFMVTNTAALYPKAMQVLDAVWSTEIGHVTLIFLTVKSD